MACFRMADAQPANFEHGIQATVMIVQTLMRYDHNNMYDAARE